MKTLIIYDSQNTFLGTLRRFRKDGNEFRAQAGIASKYYGGATMLELPKGNVHVKRRALYSQLNRADRYAYDRVLFFMHGHPRRLNRGMLSPIDYDHFSSLMRRVLAPEGKVVLFSCKTAKLIGGFADTVARLAECDVIGHRTSGHTTRNPYKIHISGMDGKRTELWPAHGGVKGMKALLAMDTMAVFRYIEKIAFA